MKLGDLEVVIGADTDGMVREVRGATRQAAHLLESGMRGAADNVNSSLKSAGGGIAGFFSNAASSMLGFVGAQALMPAIGSAVGFVTDSMFGLSSQLEMAKNGFTSMLGSADLATAHLDELKQFAAQSPFEFPDVVAGSRRLLAMGIAADEVVPTLSAVGNAVAAMGGGKEQIDRVTTALGQMNAKGKVSAEEMMQLAEAGIPAWDMLATSIGKSIPETQKLVSEGQITADTFREAFNAEVPKRFGDAMAVQAQTLPGLLSTVKDTVAMGLAGMAAPLTESLKGTLSSLSQTLGPMMESLGTAFGPLLGSVGQIVSLLAAQLTPIITALAPIIGQTATILSDALGTALGALVPVVGQLLTALAPILPMLADLAATVITALAPVLAALGEALVPVIDAMITGLRPVFDALLPIVPMLVDALMPLVDVLLELLVSLTPLIPPMIELNFMWVKMLPHLIPIIEAVADLATTLIRWLLPAVNRIVGWLTEFAGALADLDFGRILEMLGDLWDGIAGWIGDTAAALPGLLVEWITGFLSWIGPLIPQAIGALIGLWVRIELWLLEQAAKLPGLLLGWVTGFLSWVGPLIASLPGRLLEVADTLREWAIGLPGKIVEWIGDIGGKMAELGPKIVEGLWNGIKDMGGWIKDRIGDFVGGVIDGFKSGFGIFSPAREMLPVGEQVAAGLALGIARSAGLVQSAVDGLTGAATLSPTLNASVASTAILGGNAAASTGDLYVTINNGDPNELMRVLEKWSRRNGPIPVLAAGVG